MVDGKALDERGQRADEVVGAAGVDDRADDALVVGQALLSLVVGGVEELVDDVGVFDGHGLADLRARVGAREASRQAHEAHEVYGVPLPGEASLLAQAAQLHVGVVDQGAEVGLLLGGELELEGGAHPLADDAGAVVEDVLEGVVLAVDVGDEVLGALGQVEDGLEVDDLGVGGAGGGELLGEQLEVLLARRARGNEGVHAILSGLVGLTMCPWIGRGPDYSARRRHSQETDIRRALLLVVISCQLVIELQYQL